MKFTLHYDGELHSFGGESYPDRVKRQPEIWGIRQTMHWQLDQLWRRPSVWKATEHHEFRIREVKGLRIRPMVVADAHLRASLDIEIARTDEDAGIFDNKGDLDNRLKTLFDGLRGPRADDKGALPNNLPDPLYCLLEDDFLVKELSIKTVPLLMPPASPTPDPAAWVKVVVNVRVFAIEGGWQILPLS